MSNQNDGFGNAGSPYVTNVRFGGSESPGSQAQQAQGSSLSSGPTGELIKETTTAAFAQDVLQESRRQPVLVDFWAPWCGPCKQLTPALEKAVRAAAGRVKLVKMNIDDHPAIAGQLGIQSIPAVIAFKDGQPVDGFMGAIPESRINEFIERIAGKSGGETEVEEALAMALQARETGDLRSAAGIYSALLQQQPDNVEGIGGLADLLLESGDEVGAEEVLASAPEDKRDAAPIAAVRTKITLAREAAKLGNPAELERRLAADPRDHQARFDLAMIQNAQGKRTDAADNLLAIVKADRDWKDDAARAQLLKFFEAWGMTDDATLAARRKLSSLLFS
jgi:putative thioredoxin